MLVVLFILLLMAQAKQICDGPKFELEFLESDAGVEVPDPEHLEVRMEGDTLTSVGVYYADGWYSMEPVE